MGSYKIRRLNLPKIVIEMLEKQHLNSCKDVLSHTKVELQTLLGMNRSKIDSLWREICQKCASPPQTAYDMYVSQQSSITSGFLPSSLHALDLLLQGGLSFGNITEITGPPGVGKTQFCFMLSILAALPVSLGGLEAQVIYIDTESAFSAERLKTIAHNRFPQLLQDRGETTKILKRILLHKVNSVHALQELIPQLETEIIRNNIKLIIFDSVASLVRKEFGNEGIQSLMSRNKLLLEQAAVLKDLAQTYNIVVFLTNQIASHIIEVDPVLPVDCTSEDEDNTTGKGLPANSRKKPRFHGMMEGGQVVPALGNTWSHCVNTRLVAQFLDASVRQLTIVKSPVAPNAAVRYTLDEGGVTLTDDDIEFVNVLNRNLQSIATKNNFLTSEVKVTGTLFPAAGASKSTSSHIS